MTLSTDEFEQYCDRLQLSPAAREMIAHIRSSEPRRRVQSRVGNVVVRHPSDKMKRVIQGESMTVEWRGGILEYESDATVREYFDQPDPPLPLEYQSKKDRLIRASHTADFFIIRDDSAGWEEWKPEEALERLTEKVPGRYVKGDNGRWHCPPAERYAEALGLYYRVRSSKEINVVRQRNVEYLADFVQLGAPDPHAAPVQEVLGLVKADPGIRLSDLLKQIETATGADVLRMITHKLIYADRDVFPLAQQDRVPIFISRASSEAYALILSELAEHPAVPPSSLVTIEFNSQVSWDGRTWRVVNRGDEKTYLVNSDGQYATPTNQALDAWVGDGSVILLTPSTPSEPDAELLRIHREASDDDWLEAHRRYVRLQDKWATHARLTSTERNWQRRYRFFELVHGAGYPGLVPLNYLKGNRTERIKGPSRQLVQRVINTKHETKEAKAPKATYGEYLLQCEELGLTPHSFPTFVACIQKVPAKDLAESREGKRAANAIESFIYYLDQRTPRHGDFPWHIVHIDHTQLDIELVHSKTGENLGRPWLTLAIDAYTRRILAVYVTFDPPSYRSCMMVLRELVQRHHRLPQMVVVDNGPEFRSSYFEKYLAYYHVTKVSRPSGKPRFGNVIERIFGIAQQELINNLEGNSKIMKNVRRVTQSVNPKSLAAWSIGPLFAETRTWCDGTYDEAIHSALGQSPRHAYDDGIQRNGERAGRFILYDENFRMLVLPAPRKGTAKVARNRGVKIKGDYYWSDTFSNPHLVNTEVLVRYDPFNAGFAYAYIGEHRNGFPTSGDGRWVRCLSNHFTEFQGRSEKEIHILTEEIRQEHRMVNSRFPVRATELALLLRSAEASLAASQQRLKDEENAEVRVQLDERPGAEDSTPESVVMVHQGVLLPTGADHEMVDPGVELDELEIDEGETLGRYEL